MLINSPSAEMTTRLFLFGSPTVEYGGDCVALPFERRNQLLVFLALKRSWVGRAELASLLWPEQESKLAYANLRKILFRLQSLRWASGIESQGGAVRFEAETDVFAFELALREQRIADALPMRRGELLAGFDDDQNEAWSSWLSFERDRLRLAWRDAALNRLAIDIDKAEGIDLSTRLLDADPLDEAVLRAHMSWLSRGGQSARARQAYQEFVRRLSEDLGLTPGAELRALHDSLGTAVWSPIAAAPAAPAKLDDGFVGRTVELRRLGALLAQDDCRLICLMGPGGVGKTRLAQRAMDEFAPGFADGVAFVPLEDISSSNELGGRLARELGVSLTGGDDALDQVIGFLRDRQMLLVVDNFEHLAAGASALDRLLSGCARLKILVTSRVRLALANEWLLPLDGLPCPEAEDQDRIEAFDAARLFVRAAQRVEPALVPSVEAAAIVDICRQVEGLPLALELAAAWTRVLSCEAIAAELRQSTELLLATDAVQPAKHASMDVVFEQSWRLLSEIERHALARLSVFRGGFSAEAARAVASASLPVLGALADKSLVRKDAARLYLHPLVQQLAAARHVDGGVTRAAHAAYFHRLLAQMKATVSDGERTALQAIEDEFENCRRAWAWSIEQGQAEVLMSSAPTLRDYCDHRGRIEDGLGLFQQAIESPSVQRDPGATGLLLSIASHFELRLDRYASAEANAVRAVAGTRRNRDRATRNQALNVLAACALRQDRLEDARRFYRQLLEEASPEGDPHWIAATLDHLALIEKRLGHYGDALRLSLQSLEQHRRLGDVAGEALCLNNLAALHLAQHDYEGARTPLREGLAICERAGIVNTRGYILANLIEVEINRGDFAAAEAHAGRALEVATGTGNRAVAAWVTLQIARLAVRRGELDAARSALADGLGLATTLGLLSMKFEAFVCFAEILEAQGETACARRVLAFGADHPTASALTRDDLRQRLAQRPGADDPPSAWPGIELDELIHRIVVESNIAHAPLIATLHGAH